MDEIFRNIAVYALPVIFAITLHEAAHAYAAKHFGDNTAFAAGRMSLNPAKHIDPVGTIALPLGLYLISTILPFLLVFGYAKPVPVDFGALRNPKRDMAFVALAGPMANFVMAVMWMALVPFLIATQVTERFPYEVAEAGLRANMLMFAFNLLPVPPLDGGRIMTSLLPNRLAYKFSQLEPYGIVIVLALFPLGLLERWMIPVQSFGLAMVEFILKPFF